MKYEVRVKGIIGVKRKTRTAATRLELISGNIYIVGIENGKKIVRSDPLPEDIKKALDIAEEYNEMEKKKEFIDTFGIKWFKNQETSVEISTDDVIRHIQPLYKLMISHPNDLMDSFTEKFEQSTKIFDRFAEKMDINVDVWPSVKGMAIAKALERVSIGGVYLKDMVESKHSSGDVLHYRIKIKGKAEKAKDVKTYTRIATTSNNIGIHQEPLSELLKLPEINEETIRSVLEKWYDVSDISMAIYTNEYLQFIEGHEFKDGKPVGTKATETKIKKATNTPIVGRTVTLSIRQGPMDDILNLENATYDAVRPVLRKWYPTPAETTIDDYTWIYLRFLRNENYIDDEGRILKKPGPEEKKPAEGALARLVALMVSHPREFLDCFTGEFERSSDIFDRFAEKINMNLEGVNPVLKGMAVSKSVKVVSIDGALLSELVESAYPGHIHKYRKKGAVVPLKPEIEKKPITPELKKELEIVTKKPAAEEEVEDVEPDLVHPIRKDLMVVTLKGKVEIYLKPLNEILQFEKIDDMTLQRVLVKYYDVPRVSFMEAIKETWKEFLQEEGYIDNKGKPTCKEVVL